MAMYTCQPGDRIAKFSDGYQRLAFAVEEPAKMVAQINACGRELNRRKKKDPKAKFTVIEAKGGERVFRSV